LQDGKYRPDGLMAHAFEVFIQNVLVPEKASLGLNMRLCKCMPFDQTILDNKNPNPTGMLQNMKHFIQGLSKYGWL